MQADDLAVLDPPDAGGDEELAVGHAVEDLETLRGQLADNLNVHDRSVRLIDDSVVPHCLQSPVDRRRRQALEEPLWKPRIAVVERKQ